MAYKRSFRSRPRRFMRRRNTGRFRRYGRFKRRQNNLSYTTQKGSGTRLIQFRGRKLKSSVFKRKLWDSTIMKTHYRSYQTITTAYNTQASTSSMTITFFDPFTNGSFFWTTAGGAQPASPGGSVPLFEAEIILRGGKWSISYTNTDASRIIRVWVWYVYTTGRPDTSIIPTTANVGWDPSVIPDFRQKYGKVFRQEAVILSPGQCWSSEKKLGIKRIDQSDFSSLLGNTPVVLMGVENMTDAVSATGLLKHTLNVSFSGDAIGTT